MRKSTLLLSAKAILAFAIIQCGTVFAQNSPITGEKYEELAAHLQSGLAQVQKIEKASDADFKTFERFNEKRINDESGYLAKQVQEGKINFSNIDEYEKAIVKKYTG